MPASQDYLDIHAQTVVCQVDKPSRRQLSDGTPQFRLGHGQQAVPVVGRQAEMTTAALCLPRQEGHKHQLGQFVQHIGLVAKQVLKFR